MFASLVAAILMCSLKAEAVIHGFLAATAVVLMCIGLACTSVSFWISLKYFYKMAKKLHD